MTPPPHLVVDTVHLPCALSVPGQLGTAPKSTFHILGVMGWSHLGYIKVAGLVEH